MTDATSIEIKFADGQILRATGESAKKIWEWWRSCEALTAVHGGRYTGPYLELKTDKKSEVKS